MRRWLLLFLVLLLPLRGVVGEAMAGQMLAQHIATMGSATHAGHASAAHAGHDCDEHRAAAHAHDATASAEAQHAHGQPAPSSPQTGGDCPTCASCQVCSSVALSSSLPLTDAGNIAHPHPDAVQLAYASAEPALSFKPPRR